MDKQEIKMIKKSRRTFLTQTRNLLGGLFLLNLTSPFISTVHAKKPVKATSNDPFKTLIIYGSNHGSTRGIAEFMGKKLEQSGISCDVKSIDDHIKFDRYSEIIMGGPIHRGKWMSTAIEFVEFNHNNLMRVPFSCFATCMAEAKQPPTRDSIRQVQSYKNSLIELFPQISPSNIEIFAGALDYEKCSFLAKLVMRTILWKNDVKPGDHRDWKAVEGWLYRVKKVLPV